MASTWLHAGCPPCLTRARLHTNTPFTSPRGEADGPPDEALPPPGGLPFRPAPAAHARIHDTYSRRGDWAFIPGRSICAWRPHPTPQSPPNGGFSRVRCVHWVTSLPTLTIPPFTTDRRTSRNARIQPRQHHSNANINAKAGNNSLPQKARRSRLVCVKNVGQRARRIPTIAGSGASVVLHR